MLGGEPEAIGEYEVRQSADGLRTARSDRSETTHLHVLVPAPGPYLSNRQQRFRTSCLTPVEDDRSLLWVLTSVRQGWRRARITARNEIFGQDQPIVNSQRPALVPEDLRRELHVRADKLSVLYRRWLDDMGVTGAVDQETGRKR